MQDAHNTLQRLEYHGCALLLFDRESRLPFANSRLDRDLHMSNAKQKVSGSFCKHEFAEDYCRISSYLRTMACSGHSPLVAIQIACSGLLYIDPRE